MKRFSSSLAAVLLVAFSLTAFAGDARRERPAEGTLKVGDAAPDFTLKLSLPCVVDGIDNRVGAAYAGWPDRLYIVGTDGTIAYKGDPGPRGFKIPEMTAKLDEVLKN